MDKTLVLSAHLKGEQGWLRINGLVMAFLNNDERRTLAIHEYIKSGHNLVEVLPVSEVLTTAKKPIELTLKVDLVKDRGAGQWVEPIKISQSQIVIKTGQLYGKKPFGRFDLELPVAFPRWHFFDLKGQSDTEEALPVLAEFFHELSVGISDAKSSQLQAKFLYRNRELIQAYGMDAQDVHESFEQYLSFLAAECEPVLEALDPSAWSVHCSPYAPIYALFTENSEPILQFVHKSTGAVHALPLQVAIIDQEVFVVR